MSDALQYAINSLHGKAVTIKVIEGDGSPTPPDAGTVTNAPRIAGWAQEFIDGARRAEPPPLERIVVAVDPERSGSETGIIAAGRTDDGHFYILGDYSMDGTPDACVKKALQVYRNWKAEVICGMTNVAGDYLEALLYRVFEALVHPREVSAWALERNRPWALEYKAVAAMRDLSARARPVGLLYRLGYVHHAGGFPELEDQMTACGLAIPSGTSGRIGALVCAITELSMPSGPGSP